MKKIIVILLICLILLTFVGCQDVETDNEATSGKSMFIKVEVADLWYIVYHKETKVMYAISAGSKNYGTFTLLVDEYGMPLLWEEN